MKLTVDIWPDDGGYVAQCVEMPGCLSQGDTTDEALDNICDAIAEMLEVVVRGGFEPVSAMHGDRRTVEVTVTR